jgi:hypothetical protein
MNPRRQKEEAMMMDHRKTVLGTVIAVALMVGRSSPIDAAPIFNVTINGAAASGQTVGLAFDFFAPSAPSANQVFILNFATNGTMGLLQSEGGLVEGDLVLGLNPSPFTRIEGDFFFNEALVTLQPFGTQTSFTLSFTENAPAPGAIVDSFAFYILDDSGLPLFPTTDPLGTDALFAFDFTGPGGALSVFGPTTVNGGNISIVVPGAPEPPIPEPSIVALLGLSAAAGAMRWRRRRHRARQTSRV